MRLYIVGEGPLESSLKNKVFNLELEEKIIFITSLTYSSWILNECDCVILPYSTKLKNNNLKEALDLEKPIISFETNNSREILDRSSSIIVENSVNGLKKGIIEYIETNGKKIITSVEDN
jgi:CDP-glycerol glycerophosphotransferase